MREINEQLATRVYENYYTKEALKDSRNCVKPNPEGEFHKKEADCKDCFYNHFINYELDYHFRIGRNQVDRLHQYLLAIDKGVSHE